MTCRVVFTREAEANLAGERNPVIREQLSNRIEVLQDNPEAGKLLRGILAGYRSLRASRNRYRIIYRFRPDEKQVVIIAIGMRKGKDFSDVYRSLERLVKRRKGEDL